jgi:hypothetical protein
MRPETGGAFTTLPLDPDRSTKQRRHPQAQHQFSELETSLIEHAQVNIKHASTSIPDIHI